MYIDIGILALLILFVFHGYRKGIIAEFISFAALIFNVVFTKEISPVAINLLNMDSSNSLVNIVVYVVIFIVVYILLNIIITVMLKTLKKNTKMGLDRLIGSIFGFLKGSIVTIFILLVLLLVANFNSEVEVKLEESLTYRASKKLVSGARVFLPEDMRKIVSEYTEKKEIDEVLKDFLNKEK